MSKGPDPRRLDVQRFAEQAGALAGREPVAAFGRLMAETGGRGGVDVDWAAQGELLNPHHVRPDVWLALDAATTLSLTCQRCLEPVEVAVAVSRRFRFAPDEATAAAEDDESEEDVLALSRSFDLMELVEDEILMALPVAPRHEQCPKPLRTSAGDDGFESAQGRRENPFAALEKLKAGRR